MRLAVDELPDVAVKAAKLLLHSEKSLRVLNCRSEFQFIAHDSGIVQQLLNLAPVIACHALRIEFVKSFSVVLALVEDRTPTQTGLRTFQDEKFKERAIVMHRSAPFFVVVAS